MSALETSESFKVQFIATSKMIIKMSKHGERLCCFYIQSDRQRIVLVNGCVIKPQLAAALHQMKWSWVRVEYCAWPYPVLLLLDRQ